MILPLSKILEQTGGRLVQTPAPGEDFSFVCVATLQEALQGHVSFLANDKYLDDAKKSRAGLILCSSQHVEQLQHTTNTLLVVCEDPYAAFAKVSQNFFQPTHCLSGISPHAIIDSTAKIHPTATIFPFVFIGPGVEIGEHTVIYSGCFVGAASILGKHCLLYPNAVVREGCVLGDRCILNPGAVVGGDGFGFAPTPKENVKIPQIGGVILGDDVELGSNATIDRGTLANTEIGRQTKIDNLVMVAHNVKIGEFCFIAAQCGIAGSTTLGDRVVCAGQVGIAGHLTIGNKVTLTAQSGVSKNIPDGQIWGGSPAKPHKEYAVGLAVLGQMAKERMKKL